MVVCVPDHYGSSDVEKFAAEKSPGKPWKVDDYEQSGSCGIYPRRRHVHMIR